MNQLWKLLADFIVDLLRKFLVINPLKRLNSRFGAIFYLLLIWTDLVHWRSRATNNWGQLEMYREPQRGDRNVKVECLRELGIHQNKWEFDSFISDTKWKYFISLTKSVTLHTHEPSNPSQGNPRKSALSMFTKFKILENVIQTKGDQYKIYFNPWRVWNCRHCRFWVWMSEDVMILCANWMLGIKI